MLHGSYLTEYLVMLTTAFTGMDVQHIPKHDPTISSVNMVYALVFLITSVAVFLNARKS